MLALVVLSPFILACLVPLLFPVVRHRIGWLVALLPLALFARLLSYLPTVASGQPIQAAYEWVPSLGISFSLYLDGLSLLFALLITGIGLIITVYSVGYLAREESLCNFYVYILLFMGAMLGVVVSNNLISLYIFWELTSISSFLLIGFWFHREESKYGALKSLLITVSGGLALLAGFVLLYLATGTYEVREIIARSGQLLESPYYLWALILVLLGAFTKSAQFPFHIWLPNAMAAPTPISAYLHSATMVKAGIYLLARMTPALGGTPQWFYTVSLVGLVTLVYGSFMAIRQRDMKAMLAFSTISQLGLVTALLGFNQPLAVTAAVFHILNHATFKGSMFLATGIVDHETGTRDVDRLGGLIKKLPATALVMGLAAFASAGLPPFNGFLSKEMFFEATLHPGGAPWTGWLFPLLAVIGSIFTFVYSLVLIFRVFFGPPRLAPEQHGDYGHVHSSPHEEEHHGDHHADEKDEHGHHGGHGHGDPWGMVVPALFLVSLTLIVGLFPGLVAQSLVAPAAAGAWGSPVKVKIYLWHGFNLPLLMSGIVVLTGAFGFARFEGLRRLVDSVQNARYNLNALYDWSLKALNGTATWLTDLQMTGYLRDYLVFIMGWFVVSVGYTLFAKGGLSTSGFDLAPVEVHEIVLIGVIIIAAVGVLWMSTRLAAVLAVGAVGMGVVLLYVIFRAPDLALTQLIVETVTLALFLLCFSYLPELKEEMHTRGEKLVNGIIAIVSGALVTLLMVSANATRLYEPISGYFIDNSYKLGGGLNIVNVILVDFRGYDTMGEITVIAVAAFSVYALVKLRLGKRGREQ
ncbi:MAG: hydrogen gas-evolving membrane-bound hydrogenase subunit E [Bacillota bacterium]